MYLFVFYNKLLQSTYNELDSKYKLLKKSMIFIAWNIL